MTNSNVKFDITAALSAAESVTARARAGSMGELKENIIEVLKAAGKPLACVQIRAALIAGGMDAEYVTLKRVCDYSWQLVHKQGKLQSPAHGLYEYQSDAQD